MPEKPHSRKALILALAVTLGLSAQSAIGGLPELTDALSAAGSLLMNAAHVPAFALLAWAWLRVFNQNGFTRPKTLALLIPGLILFALADEYHQSFVPGRTASVMDICLDLAGITLGAGLFAVLTPTMNRNENAPQGIGDKYDLIP